MSAHLKALIGVVVALLIIIGSMTYFKKDEAPQQGPSLDLVERMKIERVPNVKQADLSGQDFNLEAIRGKILIVNFWASWCEPCVEEVPSLLNLIEKMNGKVELVAVSGDSERGEIDSFLKSFPGLKRSGVYMLWDEKKDIMKAYGVERLPETFIVGPDMKLVKKVVGSISWDHEESVRYFNELAQKHSL